MSKVNKGENTLVKPNLQSTSEFPTVRVLSGNAYDHSSAEAGKECCTEPGDKKGDFRHGSMHTNRRRSSLTPHCAPSLNAGQI